MNLQEWDMANREAAVRTWIWDMTCRLKLWRRWKKFLCQTQLRDAYERGYNHGWADRHTGQERTRSSYSR